MAEARSWREVRLGIAVIAVLGLVLFLFWVQRGRNPFAEAYSLVFFVDDAEGLEEGAPVTLSGLRVGEVRRIDVMGPSAPARARHPDRLIGMNIQVVLDVIQRYREEITDRSRARISTRGVSGARYVRIEKGPAGGRPLRSGDRIATAPSLDVEFMLARGAQVVNAIESLNKHSAEVETKVRSGGGTLGRFLADPSDNAVAENFEGMNLRAARVMKSLNEGEGTLALERRTRRIRTNLDRFQASLGEIRRRMERGAGSLAAFATDRALLDALARLQATAAAVSEKLERGDGSLGRLLNDPELYDQLKALTLQLDSLTTQVMEDPLGSVDIDLR